GRTRRPVPLHARSDASPVRDADAPEGRVSGGCAMTPALLWTLVILQMAMGAFDIVYHHEMTERLAWRPSQKAELLLHGGRNAIYAALFVMLGWYEPHGGWAILIFATLCAEVVITLVDFVEEDRTRKLPVSERITHTLLAINYGAILVLVLPILA